jgi:hypothetical protein
MNMIRFNADEIKALRRAALALDQSDYEITKRLEAAFDQITLMLDLLHDQSSTETLIRVDTEICRLLDKLEDTRTILQLVIRERALELKLAEVDRAPVLPAEELTFKDRIIAKIKTGEKAYLDDEGDPLSMDPYTLKRIQQQQQLEAELEAIDTVQGELTALEEAQAEEVLQVLRKYAQKKAPIYQQRQQAIDQIPLDGALALDAFCDGGEHIATVAANHALVRDARQAASAWQHRRDSPAHRQ